MSDISFESATSSAAQKKNTETLASPHESHSIQITNIRLNGDNFLRRSQSVQMYIRRRGKIGYLTGDSKAPDPKDPLYANWDAENSMVMTWLVNPMDEDISSNYLC